MQRFLFIINLILLGIFLSSWGFFGHKTINRLAVFTLPEPLIGFYKKNIDYLTENAVNADKRRYSDPAEACRHYIDLDHFECCLPIDTMPKIWKDAVEKYSQDTLEAYGIVPWHINNMMYRLTEAMKKGDKDRIMFLSADIGHYVADANVPLHTSENYDGQMTNQKGIHGFWESRLPELFYTEYDFFVGKAEYLKEPHKAIWQTISESFAARDSVLTFESELNQAFEPDRKYALVQKGATSIKTYSEEYSREYHKLMNGMVERRMRCSIKLVGDIWLTCWINAGQPDLNKGTESQLSEDEKKMLEDEEQKYKEGKIIGRPEE